MAAAAKPLAGPLIRRIELSDFRAFPAKQPGNFDLGEQGCNLLVFGENGSGKSSLYRALRGMFSVSPRAAIDFRNVFTDPPQTSVKVTMSDASVLAWTAASHPTAEVRDIARRSAFLSHTRLIEMNTGVTEDDAPNLFDVAVKVLLADYEATLSGGAKRSVGELWADVESAFDERVQTSTGTRRASGYTAKVQAACDRFNDGMGQAIGALETAAKPLLRRLLDALVTDGLELVGLIFYGVKYDKEKQELVQKTVTASVKFRTFQPTAPQNFLNEARQSALAIAIYLAARKACVPPTEMALKLLVLDDLLISLDTSHRRPILETISELFANWQIILLTHDRYWFELAREQLDKARWRAVEVYEQVDGDGLLVPLVRPVANDVLVETLKQADAFLIAHQPAAAANYARSACELALRRFCLNKKLQFPYFEDAKRPDMNALLEAAMKHVVDDPARLATMKALDHHKRYILNPLSHDPIRPVAPADVKAAIAAVREVVKACARDKP